jgi:thiol-disulfide isomerase/thioredoxin
VHGSADGTAAGGLTPPVAAQSGQPGSPAESKRARRRLSGRARAGLLGAAAVLLCVALVTSLTATSRPASRLVTARNFDLAALGQPGQRVSLAAFAGRPVIVNFFASWCAPCKRETPLLERFYTEHHGRVLIIGVDSNDESAAALAFLHAEGVTYPVGYDAFPAPTAAAYGIVALPQTYLLNSRHQIVRHISGDLTAGELTAWARTVPGAGES